MLNIQEEDFEIPLEAFSEQEESEDLFNLLEKEIGNKEDEKLENNFLNSLTNKNEKENNKEIKNKNEDLKDNPLNKDTNLKSKEFDKTDKKNILDELLESSNKPIETNESDINSDAHFSFLEAFAEESGFDLDESDIKIFEEAGGGAKGAVAVMENFIREGVESSFASEEVKEFNRFVASGGNPTDFYNALNQIVDYDSLDIENPETQVQLLIDLYTTYKGLDREDAINLIKADMSSGKLTNKAYQYLEYKKQEQSEYLKNIADEQEKSYKESIEQYKENVIKTAEFIKSATSEQLGGIDMNNKQKDNFIRFLFEKDSKSGLTPYQKKLKEDAGIEIRLAALAFAGVTEGKLPSKAQQKAIDKFTKNLESTNIKRKNGNVENINFESDLTNLLNSI